MSREQAAVRVADGIVTDDSDAANPVVRIGGSSIPVAVANYAPGYVPADDDKVVVLVAGGTVYLVGVKQ